MAGQFPVMMGVLPGYTAPPTQYIWGI
jgi:hypothetical protein